MTNKEIDRISRSWVGHIATNPKVREKMSAAKTDTDWADLINELLLILIFIFQLSRY